MHLNAHVIYDTIKGDPQSVFSRFGDVVLFLQWTIFHFGVSLSLLLLVLYEH